MIHPRLARQRARTGIETRHHDVLLVTAHPDLRALSGIATPHHDVLLATAHPDLRALSAIATPHHDVLLATAHPDLHALSAIATPHHDVLLATAVGLKTHSVVSMMPDVRDTRLAQRPPGNVGEGLDRPEIHGVGRRVARPDRLRGGHHRFAAVEIPKPGRPYTVPEQQPSLGTVRSIQR